MKITSAAFVYVSALSLLLASSCVHAAEEKATLMNFFKEKAKASGTGNLKEDESYWNRLMQETVMSITPPPTLTPPPPPTLPPTASYAASHSSSYPATYTTPYATPYAATYTSASYDSTNNGSYRRVRYHHRHWLHAN